MSSFQGQDSPVVQLISLFNPLGNLSLHITYDTCCKTPPLNDLKHPHTLFRNYFQRRVRDGYKESMNLTEGPQIQEKLKIAQQNLEMIRRQVNIKVHSINCSISQKV